MDLLLTHGYFLYEDPHELAVMKPYPPLGILYISSYLKSKGFAVSVFDTTFDQKTVFHEYINQRRPAIIGIYSNLMTRVNVLEMIQFSKSVGAVVILGGPDPVSYPTEYLERGADVVVVGEGELTLTELLPHLSMHGPHQMEHIKGIVYRAENERLIHTPPRPQIEDLDALPFPDRETIDVQRYVDTWREYHGMGSVSLLTARGCPYRCKWCSHAVFGYTHRRRTPQNVADELELIKATYQPDIIWYADDVFTINHRWLFAYHQELKRRNLLIPFETITREDRLDEGVIQTLAEMGCYRLWIGSESGSQAILDAMERRTDAARVQKMTHLLQAYGIEVGMFIMLGYDGETRQDLEKTVTQLKEANPDIFLTTVAYPIHGTQYYHDVSDRVIVRKPWHLGSDRDHTVAGRYSKRFYEYASRWIVNEVAFHKGRQEDSTSFRSLAKNFVNARIGRLGMALTQYGREGQP